MRTVPIAILVLLICALIYGYNRNPDACWHLVADLRTDFSAIYVDPVGPAAKTAPVVATNAPPDTGSRIISGTYSPTPATAAAPKAPAPPALPALPNWTWTTTDGKTYRNVVITKIGSDTVTIITDDGGAEVPIATLPADIQGVLHYDPAAAAASQAQRLKDAAYNDAVLTQFDHPTTDLGAAEAKARDAGKLVLVEFTGSDWSPDSMNLQHDVLSTEPFRHYSADHYVFVTLDFPRGIDQPADLKTQNVAMAQRYAINSYPTLIVMEPDGRELGRHAGYVQSDGATGIMAWLDSVPKS